MNRIHVLILVLLTAVRVVAQTDYCATLDLPGLLFCDDFETIAPLSDRYFEANQDQGDLVDLDSIGRDGSRGLRSIFQAGEIDAGGIKKSFGRTPSTYIGKHAVEPDSTFMEIYWKLDVRHQEGWQGNGPAKLCRALTLANANWATGAMAHLWTGGPMNRYLGMDPASGISVQGNLVTTKYNDFPNLRWLGWTYGVTPMFADEEAGRWFCVEGHVRLNTPGKTDGVFEFWIDDTLQAGAYALNWHATWNANPDNYGINALFINNYWNDGSPVEQARYFDNIVIATERIGCPVKTTAVEPPAALPVRLDVTPVGWQWSLPPGLSGELRLVSPLGQVAGSVRISGSGSYDWPSDLPSGLWFYAAILSDGRLISAPVYRP